MGERATVASIEVVYALPDEQHIVTLRLRPGMTAGQAVADSGFEESFPEIGESELMLGIFGTRVEASRVLRAGDRVEICRPLGADAREMRRRLLASGKVMGE